MPKNSAVPADKRKMSLGKPNQLGALLAGAVRAVVLAGLGIGLCMFPAAAQQAGEWSSDAQVPGYADETFTPVMVADAYGTVHAFVNQWVGEEDAQLAIVYRQWTPENGWTEPNDVLLAPSGDARIIDALVDSDGMIHLMFWGGEPAKSALYYAAAPVTRAWQAPAWTTPQIVGLSPSSLATGALAGDDKGNLVIIYGGIGDGNGVYAIHSVDAGSTWSDPYPVFLTYDQELLPYSLDAVYGMDGKVHAVWNVVTAVGTDETLHYSRYDIDRQQWNVPVALEQRVDEPGYFGPSFPRIVDTGAQLVILYNGGNPVKNGPVPLGRPVMLARTSGDYGESWSDAAVPFTQHLGRSGEHALVVDSNGVATALSVQRIDISEGGRYSIIGGVWYSELRGNQWSQPSRFTTQLSPHDLRAVIRLGNELMVAWHQDPGDGEHGVWYSYTTLDAPRLPPAPLPTVLPTPTATAILTAVPSPNPTGQSVMPPVPVQAPVEPGTAGASGSRQGPANLLIVAALPVTLVLAALFVAQLRTQRGR